MINRTYLLFVVFLCGFLFYPGVSPQCLTRNDDMSRVSPTDLSGIVKFNLDLFKEIVPTGLKENFIFSPYSIWNALTLAYFGSDRATERQFRRVLRVGDKISTLRLWRTMEYLYLMRPETSVNNTFVVANRAYFDKSVYLRICMYSILHNEIRQIDFGNTQRATATINKFISDTTEGAIEELVSVSDVANARMVLANAAYFKGSWKSIFDVRDTRSAPFFNLDNTQDTVQMMMQIGSFNYGFDDNLQAEILELPYSGEVLSMFIFLPYTTTEENFSHMIHEISEHKLESLIKKMRKTQIRVNFPKFSVESHVGHQLMEALKRMGLKDAFKRGIADFTDFTMFEPLSLDKSVHKAYIDVNEEGTVAAAATAFIATKIGGNSAFECNHPFVYMIRDNDTKNLLFIGTFKSSTTPANAQNSPDLSPDSFIYQQRTNKK